MALYRPGHYYMDGGWPALMGIRDDVELALLGVSTDCDLAERVGECVDILLKEGVLNGSESAHDAVVEIILQAIAEGG